MVKEYYNIWIIFIFFSILFSKFNIGNKSNIETPVSVTIPNNYSHSVSNTSTYSFAAKSMRSPIQVDSVTATVDPTFTSICNTDTLQLLASGGSDYLWISNPGNPSGGSLSAYDIPDPVFSNGFSGSFYVYDVVVTDTLFPGFADTARVIISILNNPIISISPYPNVFTCENEEVVLTADGGVSYSWVDVMTGTNLGSGDTLIVSPSTTTTYRVTGSDSNGCYENIETTIFVEVINAFANASEPAVCEGDSVLLTGGTGDQLTWFLNDSIIGYGSNIYVSPLQNTTYDLFIENSSGCRDSAEVTVEYYDLPVVLNPTDHITNCSGGKISKVIYLDQPIQGFTINSTGSYANEKVFGNLLTFELLPSVDTTSFSVNLFGENNGCGAVETFDVLPCDCVAPVVSGISVVEAKCNGKDGAAAVAIDDEAAYFYNWLPDLGTIQGSGNSRTNLPPGSYIVEIIDTSNLSCSSIIPIVITNSNGPEVNAITTPAICSFSNGTAVFNPTNFTYLWEDSLIASSRNDLSSGAYLVTVTDPSVPGCSNTIIIEILEENQLSAVLTIDSLPDCGSNNGSISIQVQNGSGEYTYLWRDGFTTSDSIRNGLSSGAYEVLIVENATPGCELLFQFALPHNVGSAEIDLIDLSNVSCSGLADGRIDYSISYDTSFVFDADTIITDGQFVYQNGQLPVGEYCLYLQDGNGCIVNSECFEISGPESPDLLFIIEPDCGLGGTVDLNIKGGTAPYTFDWSDLAGTNNVKDRTGLTAGQYVVTISDSNNCTLFSEFVTIPLCAEDCDFFGGVDTLILEAQNCFSKTAFCFSVPINDLENCQIFYNGTPYSGSVSSCDNDTISNGFLLEFEPGFHEIIIVDTFYDCFNLLITDVLCSNTDNICINEKDEFCVDAEDLDLIGNIASITNLCPDSVDHASFEFDLENLCIYYEGKIIGTDTMCIEVCDSLGNCETLELIVTVENCLLSTTSFFEDTIYINETLVYCPDTSELVGEIVSINNFCPDQSGDFVDFFLDQNSLCVEYTGFEIGIDSACIEICDNFGFCDSTFMYVTVEEISIPPVAIEDCDTTNMGTPVVLNILANDTLLGRITSAKLISEPMWGTAKVNLDRSVTYNASDEFCERLDSFQYEICTEGGCDTATICVWITCVDIFIFTAVSSNKDGINDVFYIAGIEDYPDSVLRIFNRWGNLVYEKENYKNTWNGTYNGNFDLPDGTYFYVLELNDEENRSFRGYLQLYR